MLLQCYTCLTSCAPSSQKTFFLALSHPKAYHTSKYNLGRFKNPNRYSSKFACLIKVGFEDISEIIHNKVLISAGVSAAIGQLSKPFTASLLYGRDFDLKAAIQAGGFPSTHSSSVVAAATCLALERGFSDSFFGLTVVYACLVMYDAQGVRREVGIHAKALNKVLSKTGVESKDRENMIDFEGEEYSKLKTKSEDTTSAFTSKSTNAPPLLLKADKRSSQTKQMLISSVEKPLLKESIGHTEVEVVAGAILGFFVSLAVSTLI